MANETLFAQYQTIAAYVDANIVPAFRSAAIMPNLCAIKQFQSGSDSIKLVKAGTVSATVASEATQHATSQYAETSPNTLAVKQVKVYVEVSDKALMFGGADLAALALECGRACAQKLDIDALALFDSFNGGTMVGTTGTAMTPAKVLQAMYNVTSQDVPGGLAVVLHSSGVFDIQTDMLTTTAAYWTNPATMSLLDGGAPAANGLKGSIFGQPVYQTNNTESQNASADWSGGVINPQYGLALGVFGSIRSEVDRDIGKGVMKLAVDLWYDVKELQDKAGCALLHAV